MKKIPVILDTDPGTDIDDQWAIAYLLSSPELDLKLVTGTNGDTGMRCDLIRRLLDAAGRTDIPVAAGRDFQPEKIRNYLELYLDRTATPRGSYPDAARAIVDTINSSPDPVTLITIAPLTNVADALRLDPSIAEKTNLVGMIGSLFLKADGTPGREREWNLTADSEASEFIFNRFRWHSVTITPLDTCGNVHFPRAFLQRMESVSIPIIREVLEEYRWWLSGIFPDRHPDERAEQWPEETTSFFDTVAVYLAYAQNFLEMRKYHLKVENGVFVDDPGAPNEISAAIKWRDKTGFLQQFEDRLSHISFRNNFTGKEV